MSREDPDPRDPCLGEQLGWGGGMVGREAGVGGELPPEGGASVYGDIQAEAQCPFGRNPLQIRFL